MAAQQAIPFFNYPALFKQDESKLMDLLRDVLSRGAFILQKDLTEFEDALKEYLGVKYV